MLEVDNIGKKFQIAHLAGGYLSLRERLVNLGRASKNEVEDFWALREVSFQAQPGQSIGIIGRNGAGKSTLLKVLSRITRPTTGKIVMRGRIASLLEVGTGFHPELTGSENIFFNGSLLGMKRKEIVAQFDEIVAFSGVEKFLDTPLKHYSSGMQLRLAFSVAAFLEPEILVIDEVLAVGDSEFQKKCLGKMEDVSKSGKTILFVSHNLSAVAQLCTHSLLLDKGQILKQGQTNEIISAYNDLTMAAGQTSNVAIANGMQLSQARFELISEGGVPQLQFSFSIQQDQVNVLSGLALLFYNNLNERVGIVDLRSTRLFKISSTHANYQVKGRVTSLPLIEGTYHMGLYIASNLFQGNKYHLGYFEIAPRPQEIMPYPARDRGYVEFDASFDIIAE
ncbi:MAG: ABC transporter ATP-binding protein [Cytophagales bacterium]|nr:ABC transporter ATP-binding protein [Cytophagales bacterium]